jgi:hypothetical protein
MRYTRWIVPIILIAALLLAFTVSIAGAAPPTVGTSVAPPFAVTWNVLAGGGGVMHSSSFILMSTLGQPAVGNMASASYFMQTGYWAGAWPYRHVLVPFIEK